MTVIRDLKLAYPHSLAFTPQTNHLVVTNSGGDSFFVYSPRDHFFGMKWSQSPAYIQPFSAEDIFAEVNSQNEMEGGPKGVAIHGNSMAVSSPEVGIKVYTFCEHGPDPGIRKS